MNKNDLIFERLRNSSPMPVTSVSSTAGKSFISSLRLQRISTYKTEFNHFPELANQKMGVNGGVIFSPA